MKITREQASLIADLQARLVDKLGIVVGYSHPNVTVIPENVDYVICESDDIDDEQIQLMYKEDLKIDWLDDNTPKVTPGEKPENDHLAAALITKINESIENGILWFDPGVTRIIDGMTLKVTRKHFNDVVDQDAVFDTNIVSSNMASMYKYSQICMAASMDRRFKALKNVIDGEWPDVEIKFKELKQKIKKQRSAQQNQQNQNQNQNQHKLVPQKRNPKIVKKLPFPRPVKNLLSYLKNWLEKQL
jgi:hypothetical protein